MDLTTAKAFPLFSIVYVPEVWRAEYGITLESRPARSRAA